MSDAAQLRRDLWKRMSSSPFVMMGPTGSSDHSAPLTVQADKDQVDTFRCFIGRDNRPAVLGFARTRKLA